MKYIQYLYKIPLILVSFYITVTNQLTETTPRMKGMILAQGLENIVHHGGGGIIVTTYGGPLLETQSVLITHDVNYIKNSGR